MQKDQVTFVVQASGISRPLPEPICLIGLSSNAGVRHLVALMSRGGTFSNERRWHLGEGSLKASEADLVSVQLADMVYGWLTTYIGIQGAFEESSG